MGLIPFEYQLHAGVWQRFGFKWRLPSKVPRNEPKMGYIRNESLRWRDALVLEPVIRGGPPQDAARRADSEGSHRT